MLRYALNDGPNIHSIFGTSHDTVAVFVVMPFPTIRECVAAFDLWRLHRVEGKTYLYTLFASRGRLKPRG